MKPASAEALLIRRGGVRVPRGFWVNGPLMGGLDASRSIDAFVRKAVLFSQHQLALALAQVGLSEWGHESSVSCGGQRSDVAPSLLRVRFQRPLTLR